MIIKPAVLILSSKHDFSCDYVISRLLQSGANYLRLNSEDLALYKFSLDPLQRELWCELGDTSYLLTDDVLRSVWFRRAIYLRDYGSDIPSEIEGQIARVQWAAFMRSLLVFRSAKWINHPYSTYIAEQKAVQLATANELGFSIPFTLFTNDGTVAAKVPGPRIVLKGIDTVLAYREGREFFAFVQEFDSSELEHLNLRTIPVIVQQAVHPKVDIRVTVVEDRVFAAEIKSDDAGVAGDWRKQKQGLVYSECSLPPAIEGLCRDLTARLGLRFGGIDLLRTQDTYTFLEINPTGEWAWLVDSAGLPIDEAIADALSQ